MKKNNSNLKDYLYDSMDYIILLLIIISVVSIISWRLDILFNSSNTMDNIELVEKEKAEEISSPKVNPVETDLDFDKKDASLDLAKNKKDDLEKTTRNKPIDKDKHIADNDKDEIIKVNIPQGSDSSTIADILAQTGAIADTKKFLDKCESMGLATKLKAGDFKISKDSSLESVITEITK